MSCCASEVNLGDVLVEGSDLYGEGVNIAARLEGIAEPGGILVSSNAYDQVKNKIKIDFDDLGAKALKNIAEPVRAYRVIGTPTVAVVAPKPVTDKPSIAVLPFNNMSSDPEQEYFSDGITEDIITELSRWRQLRVLLRHATFQFRGAGHDLKRIGRELDAHYVVEGSVRRIGNRLRITAQLIDAVSGSHIWAERYDRELKEIFAVQDELVGTIVGILVGRVQAKGAEQARRHPPTSLAAYECVLRGHALPWGDPESDAEAKRLYEKAIELDPGYGLAHAKLALMMLHEWFISGSDATLDRAFELANKAVLLDENESYCQLMLGYVHLFRRSFDLAEHYHRRALEMNPNNPEHLADLGGLRIYLGRPNEAFDFLKQAKRVDPYFDPSWYWDLVGLAHFSARRYREAIGAYQRASSKISWIHASIAACHAHLGELALARERMQEAHHLDPAMTVGRRRADEPFKNSADLEHLLDGLRKAGLPE